MKITSYIKVIALLVLIFNSQTTFSAPAKEVKEFDQESYEKETKGIEYSEDFAERQTKDREPLNFDPPNLGDWSVVSDFLKIGILISVVLLLAYIAFRIFEANYVDRKVIDYNDRHTIENLEEHIHDVDLYQFLKNALAEGDYKLAVRVYYLIIIKGLSDSELINWKKQKTNGEYLSELYGHKSFEAFRNNTVIFERIWYGDIEIGKHDFDQVQVKYDAFIQSIPKPILNE